MDCICLGFIVCFIASISSLIFNLLGIIDINNNALDLYKLNLDSQLVTSEVLSLLNMNLVLITYPNITKLPTEAVTAQKILELVFLGKETQNKVLPNKYFFDENYNRSIT